MEQLNQPITVALADDHVLFRHALARIIGDFEDFTVTHSVSNGQELFESLQNSALPRVILLDLKMPVMDGYESALRLKREYPDIIVMMLSMYDSDITLVRFLQAGVRGFLRKDIHPGELKYAIRSAVANGFFYPNYAAGKMANIFRNKDWNNNFFKKTMISDVEMSFMRLACTELTYKEIAEQMGLNPRTVDNLRDGLFEKLNIRSRIGLAMYAIRNGLVNI
jgi:DNA-binding NarL/FixJ family response regulator